MAAIHRARRAAPLAQVASRRVSLRVLAALAFLGAPGIRHTDAAPPIDRVHQRTQKRRQQRRRRLDHRRSRRRRDLGDRTDQNRGPNPSLRTVALVVVREGSQLIPNDTQTTIQFNHIVQLIGGPGDFDLATSRFTAGFSGVYTVSVSVAWDGGTPDDWQFVLHVNGPLAAPAPVAAGGTAAGTVQFAMERGSSVEMVVFQDSGGPAEVVEPTFMSIVGIQGDGPV